MLLAAVLILLLSGVSAFAAEDERFALVIGNAAYDGEARLANSSNDANDMAEALSLVGWQVTKVIDGDRKTMNRAIASFRDTLSGSRNPTALLFYAGHGIQIGGTNYLIPIKENFETPDDVVSDAVSLQTILNAFDDAKVSTNIVILDACRDNPFVKKNTRSLGGTRGLSVVSKSPNVEGSAVLFSTAPGDTAADGTGRNGLFTQALLKFITSPDLTLQQVATKVTGEVKKLSGGKQTPYSSLSLSDDFWIVPASMRTAAPATAADVPTVAVQPVKTVQPDPNAVKASLILQKEGLLQQKKQIRSKDSLSGILGITGWSVAALGAGSAGYAFWAGGEALKDYRAANTQVGFDGARDKMNGANTIYTVGLIAGGTGLIAGVVSLFLGPDTSSVDKQIQDVDKKITLLGGN
jgi:hypothetical protein